jgi:hypothetical protein
MISMTLIKFYISALISNCSLNNIAEMQEVQEMKCDIELGDMHTFIWLSVSYFFKTCST